MLHPLPRLPLADGHALADGLAWVFVGLGLATVLALGLVVSTLRLSFGAGELDTAARAKALRTRARANFGLGAGCTLLWLALGADVRGDEAKLLLGTLAFLVLGAIATRRA